MSYVYKRTEPRLWTVGYTDGGGNWEPESDHGSKREAADRVIVLNGGTPARSNGSAREYWEGHKHGYMDAVKVIWELQHQAADAGDLPLKRQLGDLADDLRGRYHRIRDRAVALDEESADEEVPA